MWAFSVLLFELITGKAAFAGMNHAQASSPDLAAPLVVQALCVASA